MSAPTAKEGDRVTGVDTHVVLIPSPGGPIPTPTPMPFAGKLCEELSATAFADNQSIAVQGSVARNQPEHVPVGGPFQKPPSNRATIQTASATVFADNKAVARAGDTALTCNDPADAPNGTVLAEGTVFAA
jgi:uncharacterized Zn-binding protein involved in type VI secretion